MMTLSSNCCACDVYLEDVGEHAYHACDACKLPCVIVDVSRRKKGDGMDAKMRADLRMLLIKHEGYERFPYMDSLGKLSVGVGYNLTDRGLPDSFINTQLNQDIEYFYNELGNTFPWFYRLNDVRQMVLIDMCFMGFKKFCEFKCLIDALSKEDFKRAGEEILRSLWAKQVGDRAMELANMMVKG